MESEAGISDAGIERTAPRGHGRKELLRSVLSGLVSTLPKNLHDTNRIFFSEDCGASASPQDLKDLETLF